MQEVGDDREERHLLAAMLRGRGGEGAPDFPMQRATHPQAAGLIQKIRHLRRHAPEARAHADDDRVVIRELVHRRNWGFLIQLEMRFLRDLLWNEFGHPLDCDLGAGLAGAFGDGLSHRLDMPIGGVIEDKNFWR